MIRAVLPATLSVLLLSCASFPQSRMSQEQEDPIEVSGRVTAIGSAPHVKLVIVTDTTHYELVGDLSDDLWKLQQRIVTVHGRIVQQAAGPGFPARLAVDKFVREVCRPCTGCCRPSHESDTPPYSGPQAAGGGRIRPRADAGHVGHAGQSTEWDYSGGEH